MVIAYLTGTLDEPVLSTAAKIAEARGYKLGVIGGEGVGDLCIEMKGASDFRSIAQALAGMGANVYVFPNTKSGAVIASLVAQLVDGASLSGVVDVEIRGEDLVAKRRMLGGRGIGVEVASEEPLVMTVESSKHPKPAAKECESMTITVGGVGRLRVADVREKPRPEVRLEDAEVIVSVGRGLRSKDDLKMIMELAELLGAEVGCSRPIATDYKWLPEERWIGLSGKKVKPKLYIAIGISGQPQHIAGITDAQTIVAINIDENAPIFSYSDYKIVDDLYKVVPELIKRLRER